MGTFQHEGLIVVGDSVAVHRLYVHATEKALPFAADGDPVNLTPLLHCSNGQRTFAIMPEGSKVGWPRHEATLSVIDDIESLVRDGGYGTYATCARVSFGEVGETATFTSGIHSKRVTTLDAKAFDR